ncbi:MAG: DUF5320 domain-containing protein [Spirochaetota bacterium]
MPRGDRTGPNGMGPATGRAAGYCAGNGEPGFFTAPGPFGRGRFGGRGFGRGAAWGRGAGFGYGRGYGWGFGPAYDQPYGAGRQAPPAPAPEQEREALGAEIEALERRVDYLKRELDAIDSEKGTTDE